MNARRWVSSATAACLLLAISCTEENQVPPLNLTDADGSPGDSGAGERGASDSALRLDHTVPGADVYACQANSFLVCATTTVMQRCNETGTGTVLTDCKPYLCDAAHQRCSQCDPNAAPVCQGSTLVICTADGLLASTTCPSGCVGNACVGCTKRAYYRDADADGYGNPAARLEACAQPAGYVLDNRDCDDLDPAAHPGQTAFYADTTDGTHDFDYNCNDLEELELPTVVNCVAVGTECQGDGWVSSVPACGIPGTWAKCNRQGMHGGCGTFTTSSKVQRCH